MSTDTPSTIAASIKPCELYADHGSARPAITQGHHIFPQYLQIRIWGLVKMEDLIWLCGTCHDNVHGWLYIISGERKPTLSAKDIPSRARALAEHAWSLYNENKTD